MTRCAGTPSGVSFMIQPTMRAPRGNPTDLASQPYVVTRPTGHARTRAKTRAASSLTCSEDGDVSLDIAFTSPAFQTMNLKVRLLRIKEHTPCIPHTILFFCRTSIGAATNTHENAYSSLFVFSIL